MCKNPKNRFSFMLYINFIVYKYNTVKTKKGV